MDTTELTVAELGELVERLQAEQRRLWQAGERVRAEVYLERHPRLVGDPTSALKIVYTEVVLREADGEKP